MEYHVMNIYNHVKFYVHINAKGGVIMNNWCLFKLLLFSLFTSTQGGSSRHTTMTMMTQASTVHPITRERSGSVTAPTPT